MKLCKRITGKGRRAKMPEGIGSNYCPAVHPLLPRLISHIAQAYPRWPGVPVISALFANLMILNFYAPPLAFIKMVNYVMDMGYEIRGGQRKRVK